MSKLRRADVGLTVDLVGEMTDGSLATVVVRAGAATLVVMAELRMEGRTLHLDRLHIHGEGVAPNALGPARLRRVAMEVIDEFDLDALVVGGAVRTTGAGPGRAPRPLRFARDRRAPG